MFADRFIIGNDLSGRKYAKYFNTFTNFSRKMVYIRLRDIMLKGVELEFVLKNIAVMTLMVFIFATISLARFKTRLE